MGFTVAMWLSSHSSSRNPPGTLAQALLCSGESQPLKGSEQSPGHPLGSVLVPVWFSGWQGRVSGTTEWAEQGPGAEPMRCCLGTHGGDPHLSFQFVPHSSPAPPPSTLTMATSAGRPTPTSAITPASSPPCRTTARRPWGPKVRAGPGGQAPCAPGTGLSPWSSTLALYHAPTRAQAFSARSCWQCHVLLLSFPSWPHGQKELGGIRNGAVTAQADLLGSA